MRNCAEQTKMHCKHANHRSAAIVNIIKDIFFALRPKRKVNKLIANIVVKANATKKAENRAAAIEKIGFSIGKIYPIY